MKLSKHLNSKTLIISIALFVLAMVFLLPHMSSLMDQFDNLGTPPDLNFGFNNLGIQTYRNALGFEGRDMYIFIRWTYDILWPIIYTFFFVNVLYLIVKKGDYSIKLVYLSVLPFVLDILENTLASIFMVVFPSEATILVFLIAVISTFKWLSIGFFFIFIITLFGYYIFNHKSGRI